MYLLFFSKKCKYSKKFVEILHELGEENFFRFVEVIKIRGEYPQLVKKYRIKEVPTIVVNSEVFVGKDAFKWLESKIKNVNHSVSSQDTRSNKVPTISGYSADNSSASLHTNDENFSGTSMYSKLNDYQSIPTPDAETEYKRTPFILPSDNLTNGSKAKDDRPDKVSRMDNDLEAMMAQREADIRNNKPRQF